MDMLLAAVANTPARRAMNAERRPATPAHEDAYYARHTLNVILPNWMAGLFALLRRGHRLSPQRAYTTRHA